MLLINRLQSLSAKTNQTQPNQLTASYLQAKGIVVESLLSNQTGRIKVHDVFWKARLSTNANCYYLPKDAEVRVVSREGLTLIVEPVQCYPQFQSAKVICHPVVTRTKYVAC